MGGLEVQETREETILVPYLLIHCLGVQETHARLPCVTTGISFASFPSFFKPSKKRSIWRALEMSCKSSLCVSHQKNGFPLDVWMVSTFGIIRHRESGS